MSIVYDLVVEKKKTYFVNGQQASCYRLERTSVKIDELDPAI
jgi:hypothetical protein